MSDPVVTRSALEGLALALAVAGDAPRAGLVLGAARALGDGSGATWSRAPDDARLAAGLVTARLGQPAAHAAHDEGGRLGLDEVLDGL
jgi:hypothetical protein